MNALVEVGKRVSSSSVVVAEQQQYLTFLLYREVFAIGILSIKEIIEYRNLTTVPMMPECIRGVINLRGSVVPVLDLSVRFGSRRTEIGKRTCIIIVEVVVEDHHQVVGVMVDAVNEVLDIPPTQIESPPTLGNKIRSDFIQGIGKIDDKFIILLNMDAVLSIDELATIAPKEAQDGLVTA